YTPPNRNYINRNIKRLNYVQHQKLIDQLKDVASINITCDFWSNRLNKSFFVMTGHWLTTDIVLKSKILHHSSFNRRHTSHYITKILTSVLKKLKILDKVNCIVIDGAANMVKAVRDMPVVIPRLWCTAHRLHLTLTNGLALWSKKNDIEDEQQQDLTLNNDESNTADMDVEMTDTEEVSDETMDDDREEEEKGSEEMANATKVEDWEDINDDEITDNWAEDVGVDDNDPTLDVDQEDILALMKKCRRLIYCIKNSSVLTMHFNKLRQLANVQRCLSNDVRTRWNSTFMMIVSILILRPLLEKLMNEKYNLDLPQSQIDQLTELELNSTEYNILINLHQVLQTFYHATRSLSGQTYISIGLCSFIISRLKTYLNKTENDNSIVIRVKKLILFKMNHYFDNDNDQTELIKTFGYLDPAGFRALNEDDQRSVEQELKRTIENSITIIDTLTTTPSPPSATTATNATTTIDATTASLNTSTPKIRTKTAQSAMDLFLNAVGDTVTPKQTDTSAATPPLSLTDEIRLYKKLATKYNLSHTPSEQNCINFWKQNYQQLPLLTTLARRYLACPASSVPSESAFSISAFLARKERSRLSGELLSAQVFLRDKLYD
ncbi:unnamed protein product, partial [Didymodactylos carnosus]